MFRSFALAAALGAVALPAFAGTAVTINMAGLDAKAAHAAIVHAAQAACRTELADETTIVQYYARPECVHGAVVTAETKYSAMRSLASR